MSNFREMAPQWLQNGCSKKFQTFKNMSMLYTILKHVVLRFRIYNYFRETFKFCKNMSKIDFAKFLKVFIKSRNLSVCPSVRPSVRPSVCLSVCLSPELSGAVVKTGRK